MSPPDVSMDERLEYDRALAEELAAELFAIADDEVADPPSPEPEEE